MKFQAPKGVSEYLPGRSVAFDFVRQTLTAAAVSAGYQLAELPVFEDTELFARGVGETTDVVTKEMYTFEDRGGRSITLRPEGTAGVMRAVIEHGLDRGQLPVKLWYTGAFFRAERPQAGRYRQFYQLGVEAIGLNDPEIDAEVIAVADRGLKALGLKEYRLEITSLGDSDSRAAHRLDLDAFISKMDLDEATRAKAAINPLRLFDDKREEIKNQMSKAPLLIDYLSAESRAHFDQVTTLLDSYGIEYRRNTSLVRGLDYYTGTTFEFVHEKLGAQSAIGGGGRYDGLMRQLGGADLSGIGFGMGLDRILLACEAEELELLDSDGLDLFVIALGTEAKFIAAGLVNSLRDAGFNVDMSYGDRALKGAMKAADKSGARFSLVIGEDEVASGQISIKDMETGEKEALAITAIADFLDSI
jgi:histidyl-tRNA synthetase